MSLILHGTNGITFPDTTGPFDGADLNKAGELIFGYGGATGGSGSTVYFGRTDASNATEVNARSPISTAGVIKNMYARSEDAPSSGDTNAYTLMLNGSATSLTCTVSGTDTSANDTSNTVTVAAGDEVSIKWVASSGVPQPTGSAISVQLISS